MTVVNEWFVPHSRRQISGRQRVEVTGQEYIMAGEQQVQEQPDVVFRIKQWTFIKQKAKPAHRTRIPGDSTKRPPFPASHPDCITRPDE